MRRYIRILFGSLPVNISTSGWNLLDTPDTPGIGFTFL